MTDYYASTVATIVSVGFCSDNVFRCNSSPYPRKIACELIGFRVVVFDVGYCNISYIFANHQLRHDHQGCSDCLLDWMLSVYKGQLIPPIMAKTAINIINVLIFSCAKFFVSASPCGKESYSAMPWNKLR